MTSKNHPENQKPNGPHDLGQICKEHANPQKPWVIVSNPGQDDETVIAEYWHFSEACYGKFSKRFDGTECDIMKRLDDGTLTTEV